MCEAGDVTKNNMDIWPSLSLPSESDQLKALPQALYVCHISQRRNTLAVTIVTVHSISSKSLLVPLTICT